MNSDAKLVSSAAVDGAPDEPEFPPFALDDPDELDELVKLDTASQDTMPFVRRLFPATTK